MRSPHIADPKVCSIEAALKIVGEKWAPLILREPGLIVRCVNPILLP